MIVRLQRVLNIVGWGGMLALLLTLIWGGFLERPYLSYGNLPFPVLTPRVKPGEPVLLEVLRCNSDDRQRVYGMGRTLVPLDSRGPSYVLPAGAASIDPGCNTSVSAVNVIPLGVPPGRYYVQGSAEINGSLRTFVLHWASQPFEVIP